MLLEPSSSGSLDSGSGCGGSPRYGFTLLELLVVVVVISILAVLTVPAVVKTIRTAKRTDSMNNMRNFVLADTLYFADRGEFPPMEGFVPSTITRDRLKIVADYCNLPLPPGPVTTWPKRKQQPKWINCPMARDSGYAEGITLGGGVYTGYLYVGRIEESNMVVSGMASLLLPEHSANRKNTRRGVLWASILGEFKTGDPRRFECFHYTTLFAYRDFRFHQEELDGIHRGWSDGSADWLPAKKIKFGAQGSDLQIDHMMGNFYY